MGMNAVKVGQDNAKALSELRTAVDELVDRMQYFEAEMQRRRGGRPAKTEDGSEGVDTRA